MKTFYLVSTCLLLYCNVQAQNFTFPTSGNSENGQLSPLVAEDGVTLVTTIRSTGCVPGGSSNFAYRTDHVSTGAIYRNTSWVAGCKGSTDLIKLNFSTVQKRPLGIAFSIYDVDNGSDSVSVTIFSAGVPVDYTYSLYTPTYVSANGAPVSYGFNGSGGNNSVTDDNTGRINIATIDPMVRVDSILVYKYNNRDVSGNPSQSFAGFSWAYSIALPIKLVSFTAFGDASTMNFNWKVAEEINTKEYQIEYSNNGYNFSAVGNIINARGTLGSETDYSLTVNALPQSYIMYFRLVSIDVDNKKSYSKIIKVHINRIIKTEVYPTIVKNSFTVSIQAEKANTGKIKMIGIDGRVVYQRMITLSKGQNFIPVEISSGISKGIYVIAGEFGGELTFRNKLIKE